VARRTQHDVRRGERLGRTGGKRPAIDADHGERWRVARPGLWWTTSGTTVC
jgi:hypothetical protein